MTYEQILQIIDELYSLNTFEICLSGGEPLLFPEFDSVVNHIKLKGMRCSLMTNGHLIEKKIESVKKMDIVSVSIDGEEEINDRVRGRGNYKSVLSALQILQSESIPVFLKVALHKYNVNSLEHIFELAERFDAVISFGGMVLQRVNGRIGKAVPEEIASDEEYRKAGRRLLDYKKKKYARRILHSKKAIKNFIDWPISYEKFMIFGKDRQVFGSRNVVRCRAGMNSAVIDADGYIYPCSGAIGIIKSYNCLELGVKKALEMISKHGCYACHFFSSNDLNLIYSLDPGTIFNFLRIRP
jgi:MoaA/NifB/PqqE/SkfB family radical SAM enzyme